MAIKGGESTLHYKGKSRWRYRKKTGKKINRNQFVKLVDQIQKNMSATTKPFKDDSNTAKEARKREGLEDFDYFKLTYFSHYCTKPSGEVHEELHELCNSGGKSINAVALPRETGKSVNVSLIEPVWKALYKLSRYSIIISDTLALAEEFIRFIKYEFENNPRLRQDFGDMVSHGWWTANDIVLKNNCRIRGMGAGQKVRGTKHGPFRPMYIVLDDLENNLNVKNKKLVKRRLTWILGAVYGSLDDEGTLIMIGTMLEKISVLSLLVEHIREKGPDLKKRFKVELMRAVVYAAVIGTGKNRRPLWPEGKSLEKLDQIKEMVGPLVWAAEFMNDPIDTGLVKLEWIDYVAPEILIPMNLVYLSGADLSARSGEENDPKAHVVIAKNMKTKHIYTAEAWIRHTSIADFNEEFIRLYEYYKMVACFFEVNGFQLQIKQDLDALCLALGLYPNVVPVTHTSDKLMRISSKVPLIQRKTAHFIKGHSDQDILVEQFHALGSNAHDDGPDAWEMAVSGAETWGGPFSFMSSGTRVMNGGGRMRLNKKLSRDYFMAA